MARSNVPIPQPSLGWSPGDHKYDPPTITTVRRPWHERIRSGLCLRLCDLPGKQAPNHASKCPTANDPSRAPPGTLPGSGYGSHHRPARIEWLQCHPHDHRPGLLEGSEVHPLHHSDHWRGCYGSQGPCVQRDHSLVWFLKDKSICD